jgi:outer membrane protein OmpA-like peptidoglycan-associated protein
LNPNSESLTMNLSPILALSTLALAVLGACSSLSPTNAQLDAAHGDYRAAQNDDQVRQLAPAELRRATEALTRADNAFERRDKSSEVDHLAYLARSQIAVAQETARQKAAEQTVAGAAAARDQARLAARTNEADAAMLSAQAAQRSAEASQQQAEASRQQSEASRQQTEAALRQANAARAQAWRSDDDARRLQAELAALNATKSERGMVVTMGDVLFDTNKSELKPGGLRSVEKLVVFLKQYPQRSAMIEGFTDSTGGSALNQALSAQRADAVRSALMQMGVSADRLAVHAYGEAYPVAGNDSAEGRQSNRRVEIILSEDKGTISPR